MKQRSTICSSKMNLLLTTAKEWRSRAALFAPTHTLLFCLFASSTLLAAPYTPADLDEVVLERNYPTLSFFQETKETRKENALEIIDNAEAFVGYGLSNNDPRYLAYAQALLAPWWQKEDESIRLLFLRAQIKQHSHNFSGAIQDLNAIITISPRNTNAILMRANAYRVSGNFTKSKRDCQRLLLLSDALVTMNCIAQLSIFAQDPLSAAHQLEDLLSATQRVSQELNREVHTTLALLYEASGLLEVAEKHYLIALDITPNKLFLLSHYAQLLLDTNRWKSVLSVFPIEIDALSARIQKAIAIDRLDLPSRNEVVGELRVELERIQRRGDLDISKELALFYLYVEVEPEKALHYAEKNWSQQKENSDKSLLVRAARLVNDKKKLN